MKLLAICGSPRKGNSDWMAEKVVESAMSRGINAEIVYLRNLNIKHCTGCDCCFGTGKGCNIKDDMQLLYKKLVAADVILLSTPNYFRNVSGIMKDFIDRTNALVKPPQLKGKKAVGLCVGGQPIKNTKHCERILKEFFKDQGMKVLALISAKADAPGEITHNKRLEKKLAGLNFYNS